MSGESSPDIVWSCPFTHVVHNKRLSVSDEISSTRKYSFCSGERWRLGGACFVYSTSKMADKATGSSVMIAVFALISILSGCICNINERVESNISLPSPSDVCILPVSQQSQDRKSPTCPLAHCEFSRQ